MNHEKKHIEVVAAIIFDKDAVYCFRRGKNKFSYLSNKFEFPGGKLEDGEDKQQALEREILEELSVAIDIREELLTIDHEYPDFMITMTCFACRIKEGTIQLSEHTEVVLQKIKDLRKLDWLPADIPAVDYLMDNT